MKKLRTIALVMLIALIGVGFDDCEEAQNPPISAGDVRLQHRLSEVILGSHILSPYAVYTSGAWFIDWDDNASGNTFNFEPTLTGTDGRVTVHDGRATAKWRIFVYSGHCAGYNNVFFMIHAVETKCECIAVGGLLIPSGLTNPPDIDTASPPSSITIFGQDFNAQGGMPTVEYYNPSGSLVQQAQATSCAEDGSWISGPTPYLSSCPSGDYSLLVRNANGDVVGSAMIMIYNNQSCNSDPEQVSNCEMALGHFWDYDTCRCLDHNP